MNRHCSYMKRALDLAVRANPAPNPKVGAVLVFENVIIAEGFHEKYGGPHAEINLFNSLPKEFDYSRTTLYVTLEPCSHVGKTPACALKIVELGIPHVVVACVDPNPLVAGKGIQILRSAGIDVTVGVLADQAKKLNEVFFKWIQTGMPFVCMKAAMTLDGKIAAAGGRTCLISSPASRGDVHRMRSEYTAIMVGINTVLQDNPKLTCRLSGGRNPIRIIVDSSLKTPFTSIIVQTAKEVPTIIATINTETEKHRKYECYGVKIITCQNDGGGRVCLKNMCQILASENIDSILLEGGSTLFYAALSSGIIDKVRLYIAPLFLGGESAPSLLGGSGASDIDGAFHLRDISVEKTDSDIIIEAVPLQKENACLRD